MGRKADEKRAEGDGQETAESELLTEVRTLLEELEEEAGEEAADDGPAESVAEVEALLEEGLNDLQQHLQEQGYLEQPDVYGARAWHFLQAISKLSWLQQLAVHGAMLPPEDWERESSAEEEAPVPVPAPAAQQAADRAALWLMSVKPWEVG